MGFRRFIKSGPRIITKNVVALHNMVTNFKYKDMTTNQVFESIYNKNSWGADESRSGQGSEISATAELYDRLPEIIHTLNIRRLLDLPCGDFNWMRLLLQSISFDKYIGADIVDELIRINNDNYATENISFKKLNLITDNLDPVDLIICRDCLVHFSLGDIVAAIKNIAESKIKWLSVTTYSNETNKDIETGGWRKINFRKEPFNFPKPLFTIDEKCTEGDYFRDKSMGIWKIDDIRQRILIIDIRQ